MVIEGLCAPRRFLDLLRDFIVFEDDGDKVDCPRLGKGGYSVPSIVEPDFIEIRRCTADFVLLVEKAEE